MGPDQYRRKWKPWRGILCSTESVSGEKSLGSAPLVALALIAVIGAVVFAFIALFRGSERADMLSSVLPAAALLLLVIQLMVGFPR